MKAKFLLTPGGFVSGSFPKSWRGKVGWASRPADLEPLIELAKPLVKATITRKVLDAARGRVQVISLGVDLFRNGDHEPHVELVTLIDVASGKNLGWTGKSYPTSDQEAALVQVVDLKSHLFEVAGERALVLGCHDLNMWSPRGEANQRPGSVRSQRCQAMRQVARRFNPSVVLQHPHSTDSPRIWAISWGKLQRELPGLKAWASGIAHFSWDGSARAPLENVLRTTRSEHGVHDIILAGG